MVKQTSLEKKITISIFLTMTIWGISFSFISQFYLKRILQHEQLTLPLMSQIINQQTLLNYGLILLSLIIFLVVGIVLAKKLTSSIYKLINGVQRISNGERGVLVDIQSRDEIGQLAQAFNKISVEFLNTMISKEYFHRIINNMLECIVVVDEKKIIRQVNQSVMNLLHYSESELIGREMQSLLSEDKANNEILAQETLDKLIKYGSAIYREASFKTKLREKIPVFVSLSVMKENKKVIGYVCVAQDISVRKQLEREKYIKYHNQAIIDQVLQEVSNGSTLEFILEHSLQYILEHSIFDFKSSGAIFLKESNTNDLVMTTHHNLAPHIRDRCSRIPFDQCFCGQAAHNQKVIFTKEKNCTSAEDEDQNYGQYIVPMISHEENLVGVMNVYVQHSHPHNSQEEDFLVNISKILANIIERKRSQDELERVNLELIEREKRLQKMLKETQEMHEALKSTHEQLLQSEKMASIGQLAAGIAHEINNPMGYIQTNLSAMRGYVEIYNKLFKIINHIKGSLLKENITEAMQVVEELDKLEEKIDFEFIINDSEILITECCDGISRVKSIITNLRNFSHFDEGEVKPNDLEAILDNTIEIAWNEIKYSVDLVKNYARIPAVECNAVQIGQVFLNIIVNAAQAIHRKGTISIKTYNDPEKAYIRISDTGEGIPQEKIKNIFNPFFTTKPKGKGTGLGLSISYNIIKEHGGEVNVTSEMNKGSTFTIVLPLKQAKLVED